MKSSSKYAIKAVVIDNDRSSYEKIRESLSGKLDKIELLGFAESFKEALSLINNIEPDLVFLGVELTDKTGFEFLTFLHQVSFEVIFLSQDDKDAYQAFKYGAIDYILKPIDSEELLKTFSHRKLKSIHSDSHNRNPSRLALPTGKGLKIISTDSILYLQAYDNLTRIHFSNNTKLVVSKTLRDVMERLPDNFFRVHRSSAVNLNHIISYSPDAGGMIIMSNGHEVSVARSVKKNLLMTLEAL